jgi:hypothetical protein
VTNSGTDVQPTIDDEQKGGGGPLLILSIAIVALAAAALLLGPKRIERPHESPNERSKIR